MYVFVWCTFKQWIFHRMLFDIIYWGFHINETHKASKKTWFMRSWAGWLTEKCSVNMACKEAKREKKCWFPGLDFFVCAVWACMQSWREEKDIMKTLPGEQIFQSKFNFPWQDGIKKDVYFKIRHFLVKLLNLKISFLVITATCAAWIHQQKPLQWLRY